MSKQPTAFITGITGQDGSYLAEMLLEKGYDVVGMIRPHQVERLDFLRSIEDQVTLVEGDLQDQHNFIEIIDEFQPDEVYNFAAQSFVPVSWSQPVLTGDITALGVGRLMEAIRIVKPDTRFFQASSSEIFGDPLQEPQTEETPINPRNPYGIAKLFGHMLVKNYRQRYGMYACSGILYNHESPRRGLRFVTRKITYTATKIKLGMANELRLGNLDARRDWGYAVDYVRGMWMMLNQETPDDYILSTGVTHSVREFVDAAFKYVGLDYQDYVVVDERFYRPVEPHQLVGNPAKAKQKMGWEPKIGFEELIKTMMEADFKAVSQELA